MTRKSEIGLEELAEDLRKEAGKCLLILDEVAKVTRYSIPSLEISIAGGDLRIFRRGKKKKRLFHIKDIARFLQNE